MLVGHVTEIRQPDKGGRQGIGNLQDAVLIPDSPVSSASSGQIYPQNKTWMRISIRFIAPFLRVMRDYTSKDA